MVSIKMSFSPDVAKVVGTDAAIILANIEFWQETNRANKKNFYNDKYWTYNSVSAFNKLFSYLSPGQIRRSLEKLEKSGYIVSGSFNVKGYDRTKWYSSVRDEYVNSICRKQQMDLSKTANGFVETDKPIPDNNTDTNTDSKHPLQIEFEETFLEFVKMRKEIGKKITERGQELIKNKLRKLSGNNIVKATAILNQSIENSWQGVFELKESTPQDNPNRGGSPNKKAL